MRGAGVVALIAMTVACTGPEVTAVTEPLAPPDTFAPTTTSTTERRTTTTVDTERAAIYRVDPITLEPIAGFDPIPVGDWAWGISSKNGSWLAVGLGHDNQSHLEMRLIDVEDWTLAETWIPAIDTPLHVADDGTVYVINGSTGAFHLSRMVNGEASPVVIADLPDHFSWHQLHIDEGRAMIFGMDSPNDDDSGEAVLVTVDLVTGVTGEIHIPGVEVGSIGYLDLQQNGETPFFASPTVVWDDNKSRVLIVEGNRDVITEINHTTAEVNTHQFGTDVLDGKPTMEKPFINAWRTAALGRPNGGVLFVATAIQTFEVVDEYLTSTSTAEGIEAIDTETWEVIDRLDVPISEIYLSSAGDRLLASGQSYTELSGTYESESSGIYVIDAVDLEVIAHHEADQVNQYFGGFTFNPGMGIGYVQSWDQLTNIDVINLETGRIVSTRTGLDIQFFPEAEVVVESVPG